MMRDSPPSTPPRPSSTPPRLNSTPQRQRSIPSSLISTPPRPSSTPPHKPKRCLDGTDCLGDTDSHKKRRTNLEGKFKVLTIATPPQSSSSASTLPPSASIPHPSAFLPFSLVSTQPPSASISHPSAFPPFSSASTQPSSNTTQPPSASATPPSASAPSQFYFSNLPDEIQLIFMTLLPIRPLILLGQTCRNQKTKIKSMHQFSSVQLTELSNLCFPLDDTPEHNNHTKHPTNQTRYPTAARYKLECGHQFDVSNFWINQNANAQQKKAHPKCPCCQKIIFRDSLQFDQEWTENYKKWLLPMVKHDIWPLYSSDEIDNISTCKEYFDIMNNEEYKKDPQSWPIDQFHAIEPLNIKWMRLYLELFEPPPKKMAEINEYLSRYFES